MTVLPDTPMNPTRRQLFVRTGTIALLGADLSAWAQAPSQPGPMATPTTKRLQPYLNNPRLVGQGKFTFWGLDIYQASLWTGDNPLLPEQWHTQGLALELRYLRDFDGKDIAKRSLDEINGQSAVAKDKAQAWLKAMEDLFPNVRKGQSLTGIYLADKGAQFLFDNTVLGELKDPELAKRFFAIWLSPQTSAPELRQKLFSQP